MKKNYTWVGIVALGVIVSAFYGVFVSVDHSDNSKPANTKNPEQENQKISTLEREDKTTSNEPVSLVSLVEPEDKTSKNAIKLKNHNALLQGFAIATFYQKNLQEPVNKKDIISLINILIYDAYITHELEEGREPKQFYENESNIRDDLLVSHEYASASLSNEYLSWLAQKVSSAKEIEKGNLELQDEEMRLEKDLLVQGVLDRKQHSDGIINFLFNKYMLSDSYTIYDKVDFIRAFVDAGDINVMRRYLELESDGGVNPASKEEQELLDKLKIDISEGLKL